MPSGASPNPHPCAPASSHRIEHTRACTAQRARMQVRGVLRAGVGAEGDHAVGAAPQGAPSRRAGLASRQELGVATGEAAAGCRSHGRPRSDPPPHTARSRSRSRAFPPLRADPLPPRRSAQPALPPPVYWATLRLGGAQRQFSAQCRWVTCRSSCTSARCISTSQRTT